MYHIFLIIKIIKKLKTNYKLNVYTIEYFKIVLKIKQFNNLKIQIYKYYINMYNYILSFFLKKHPYPFNKEFKKGYKNAWIDKIKYYTP